MKIQFTVLCLFTACGMVRAAVQATLDQDKPARIYLKTYTEKRVASFVGFNNAVDSYSVPGYGTGYHNYSFTAAVNESINYTDGVPGSASCRLNETLMEIQFMPGWEEAGYPTYLESWNMGGQRTMVMTNAAGTDPSSVPTTEVYTSTGWYDAVWTTGRTNPAGANITNVICGTPGMPVFNEHCDVTCPFRDHSAQGTRTEGEYTHTFHYTETYARTAQAVWKLQTGGRSRSKLRHLFALYAGAMEWVPTPTNFDPLYYSRWYVWYKTEDPWSSYELSTIYSEFEDPFYSSLEGSPYSWAEVPSQNIAIGSYGNLGTNGILYKILPDNSDVDVTPYIPGSDFYGFFVNFDKYLSYFTLYVQQARPGYSFWPTGPYDVGHAFWSLSTEAPQDALQYISPQLTNFLGHAWGFYPVNGLFTEPGNLGNDDDHSKNIERKFCIGFPDLVNGLEFTRNTSNAPPVYCLSSFNCVGAARGAAFYSGIHCLPWDESPQNFGVMVTEVYPGPWLDTNNVYYSHY